MGGFVVVSQSFSNPVNVNGANKPGNDFVLGCGEGRILGNGSCVYPNVNLSTTASDGTYRDYVLVTWNPVPEATSYYIYRSDTAGTRGELIATVQNGDPYRDTTAIPGVHYFYTIVSSSQVTSNQDEGWRPGDANNCPPDQECIFEDLEPRACASANGFLGQTNIATVISRYSAALQVTVEYRDLYGTVKGQVQAPLSPYQKRDFLVTELGLEPDTYGTVCVSIDIPLRGLWSGGVTLYKANGRDGDTSFGSDFDFVLYYSFTNPRTGTTTLPLNTFHLGVRPDGTIANWIRLTDAVRGDSSPLQGRLEYINDKGEVIKADTVYIPDGGRFDYSGHEGLAGVENNDAVGMARFIPDLQADGKAAQYYVSLGRYYYDCVNATCVNFYTAFVMPHRPATTLAISGGVAPVSGELSVLEFNNTGAAESSVALSGYQADGSSTSSESVLVPALATRHVLNNNPAGGGALTGTNTVSTTVKSLNGDVSAISIFYKLDQNGVLQYAYAAPLIASPGLAQISEFNSFIENVNTIELVNSGSDRATAQLQAYDADNNLVLTLDFTLDPNTAHKTALALPRDTYGTLLLQSDKPGLTLRNYVSRPGEYSIAYTAR